MIFNNMLYSRYDCELLPRNDQHLSVFTEIASDTLFATEQMLIIWKLNEQDNFKYSVSASVEMLHYIRKL